MFLKRLNKQWQSVRDQVRRNLGLLLFDRKVESAICPLKDLQHVVFIRWDSKWGDAVVSSLMIEPLRLAYPDIKITVVSSATLSGYFDNYLNVDRVIITSAKSNYRQIKKLAIKLGSVDLLIHFKMNMKMKDLYLLHKVQAKAVAGLDDEVGRVNLKLGKAAQNQHFSQKFVFLLQCLDIKNIRPSYQIPLDAESVVKVQQFLASKKKSPLLVINSQGGDRSRRLNKANTKKIISEILSIVTDINIVVLTTPETLLEVQKLCLGISKDSVFYYPQSKTIYDAIALVSIASWVISVDTAIVHIASGLNKPLLALYNPDKLNYTDWHPNSDQAITCFSEQVNPPDINALAWLVLLPSLSKLLRNGN